MNGTEVAEILNALSDPAQHVMQALVWRTIVDGVVGTVFGAALMFGAWKLWHHDFGEGWDAEHDRQFVRLAACITAFLGAVIICICLPALLAPEGQTIQNLFNN